MFFLLFKTLNTEFIHICVLQMSDLMIGSVRPQKETQAVGEGLALGIDRFILLIILQVKTAVRRVFCAYLSLLVNSKNDMALAQTLDVPSRCLGRQAFTDIKRAAQKSKTSLFLVTNPQPSSRSFASFITVKQQYVSNALVVLC